MQARDTMAIKALRAYVRHEEDIDALLLRPAIHELLTAFDNLVADDAIPDPLTALWRSTEALFKRFDMFPPDVDDQLKVFAEEVLEFQDEINTLSAGQERTAHEAADVIVTILGLLQARYVSFFRLTLALEAVAAKNDAKTHETHFINPATGKIQRRAVAEDSAQRSV